MPEQEKTGLKTALSLGGNTGDVVSTLEAAVRLLEEAGFRTQGISRIYRTRPVDCAPGTPDFCNQAVTGVWYGTPEELLNRIKQIEIQLGRPSNHGFHTDRTADIDIITCGTEPVSTKRLTIPHPEAFRRKFVLEPLMELDPDWKIGSQTAAEWFARLPDSGSRENAAERHRPLPGRSR